jgi:hypothetical protein
MTALVTAPDEITELHNALMDTPLEAVDQLRRLAFRARGLAANRLNDVGAVLTAAQALAQSGQRDEALPFARRVFDMRFGAAKIRDEITALCTDLALFDEARTAADEICSKRPYTPNLITITNCCYAAFLAGDIALLRRVRDFAPENLKIIADDLLAIIERDDMEPYLSGHMQIVNRHVSDACCWISIEIDCYADYGDEQTIAVDYHLALPMNECLRRSTAMAEDLLKFYRDSGCKRAPFLNAVIESFIPMPGYMDLPL